MNWKTSLSSRRGLAWTTRSFSRGSDGFTTAKKWNTRIARRRGDKSTCPLFIRRPRGQLRFGKVEAGLLAAGGTGVARTERRVRDVNPHGTPVSLSAVAPVNRHGLATS